MMGSVVNYTIPEVNPCCRVVSNLNVYGVDPVADLANSISLKNIVGVWE